MVNVGLLPPLHFPLGTPPPTRSEVGYCVSTTSRRVMTCGAAWCTPGECHDQQETMWIDAPPSTDALLVTSSACPSWRLSDNGDRVSSSCRRPPMPAGGSGASHMGVGQGGGQTCAWPSTDSRIACRSSPVSTELCCRPIRPQHCTTCRRGRSTMLRRTVLSGDSSPTEQSGSSPVASVSRCRGYVRHTQDLAGRARAPRRPCIVGPWT
jgi:hypothetical protein